MMRAATAAGAFALLAFAANAPAGSSPELQRALRTLAQAAQTRGWSPAEAGQAAAALQGLADRRLPVRHALQVALVAVERGRSSAEVLPLVLAFEAAYRSGAEPQELVNLARDLASEGLGTNELAGALRALGRLAEDGYTDAEARHELALAVRHSQADRRRDDPGEAAREEARETRQRESGERAREGGGRADAPGQERAEEAHDRNELRDELRRNPPPGLTGEHPPGGVPRRGPRNDRGRNP